MNKAVKGIAYSLLMVVPLASWSGRVEAYSNTRMIEDHIFDDLGRMNETQTRGFLEGTETSPRLPGGSPCLKAHNNINFHWDGSNWHYGDGTKSQSGQLVAATWNPAWGPAQLPAYAIIHKAAVMWGFNPQVILSTLQKEQSLVWGTNCSSTRFNSAMGYDCPDSGGLYDYPARGVFGTCVAHERYVGFTRQVLWGSWQLKFAKERSMGNTGWNGDSSLVYGGYMTQGTYRRCGSCTLTYFSGNATIDGQTIFLENGATASLYSYTPHLNQSFPGIFENWFGSPTGNINDVHRLANYITKERLFTINAGEKNAIAGKNGWVYEGVAFKAPLDGTTDVYRLANYITKERLFTLNAGEKDFINGRNGWVYEGVAFKVAPDGAIPIYRMANFITKERLFTANAGERDAINGRNGWVYEGVAFRVVP